MKGEILKELRLNKELTQKDLAKKLGIAQTTIAMIETNKRKGNKEITHKIADFFNVSLDYLEGRTNKEISLSKKSNKIQIIDEFLNNLIKDGIIKNPNDIDESISEMILNEVKVQVALKFKKGKKED